ncbi:hypothetical protein WM40_09335 [Robbsia andropogonis]|uniref:Transmembrane protein n=2 Tax=Robbsia andropogonis TaxID=28092 RepID=A0A0F5K1T6_9BURK|nr:hypothetical protein WM40_09335 [Robbsia andropogonis]
MLNRSRMTRQLSPPPCGSTLRQSEQAFNAAPNRRPHFHIVTEARRSTDPEIDSAYDKAMYTRSESIVDHGLRGAHSMMRRGLRLTVGALAIAAIGAVIGFHAWQDQTTRAAAMGNEDMVVVETVSDDTTTLLLAGTLAQLVGFPRAVPAAKPDAASATPIAATVSSLRKAAISRPPVWLARTVSAVASLPATLSPSRLVDPVTQAVRTHVSQAVSLAVGASNFTTVATIFERFQFTMERTLPDALERATPQR